MKEKRKGQNLSFKIIERGKQKNYLQAGKVCRSKYATFQVTVFTLLYARQQMTFLHSPCVILSPGDLLEVELQHHTSRRPGQMKAVASNSVSKG